MEKYTTVMKRGDGSAGNKDGYRYEVRGHDGRIVVSGWTLGGKRDAKAEADRALAERGLR